MANMLNAQSLVNKVWETHYGLPSEIEWSATILDGDGNILTTGHSIVSETQTDLLLTKHSPDGTLIWESIFTISGSATKNYGVAITLDQQGDILLTGTATDGSANHHDLLIIKFDSTGNEIWNTVYNGSGSGDDGGTAIITDANDYIYVAGASVGDTTGVDYITLRLDPSGTILWEHRYDFNNLPDIPVSLNLVTNGVAVTGTSASTLLNWDIATIKIPENGNNPDINRYQNAGLGIDQPAGFVRDDSGNFYITGSVSASGGDYDIKTIKLDSDLNFIWDATYDDVGLEDRAYAISIDKVDGSIYVSGSVEKTNLGKDFMTIKYNLQGTQQWLRRHAASKPHLKAEAFQNVIDSSGNLIVTGELEKDGTTFIQVINYDKQGNTLWENSYKATASGMSRPTATRINEGGDILITGVSSENGLLQYTTFKLETFENTITYDYDLDSIPINVDGALIIRFAPNVVNLDFVDDGNMQFDTLKNIITDQILIDEMEAALNAHGKLSDWMMRKVYANLHSEMNTVTSRSGETVRMDKIWSTFVLYLEGDYDEFAISDTLTNLKGILYAIPDLMGQLTTCNDPTLADEYYNTDQASLHDIGTITNAHMNVLPVWEDYNINGDPNIKVGIFDAGINLSHEDMYWNDELIVVDGWDFVTNPINPPQITISTPQPFNSHGTSMAGLVGAVRNNGLGISGVAGGDYCADEEDRGVSLYNFKQSVNQSAASAATRGAAVFVLSENELPLIDIASNAWQIPNLGTDLIDRGLETIYALYKANVISVYSRGNYGNDEHLYPNTYCQDDWVIAVGSNGTDGMYKNELNIGSYPEDNYESSYGKNMDIIAPGAMALNYSIGEDAPDFYKPFSGTSSASPNVAGVVALLLEYNQKTYNFDLAVEDVEHLLEYSATDIVDGPPNNYVVGYDEKNAWGRINAAAALDCIDDGAKVVHVTYYPQTYLEDDCETGACAVGVYPFYTYSNDIIFQGPDENNGSGIIRDYSTTINIDLSAYGIGDLKSFTDSEKKPYWIRNSSSNLWEEPSLNPTTGELELSAFDQSKIVNASPDPNNNALWVFDLSGFTYEFLTYPGGPNGPNIIIPNTEGEPLKFCFSILAVPLVGNTIPNEIILNEPITSTHSISNEKPSLNIFPNPTEDIIDVNYHLENTTLMNLAIYDVNGQLVKTILTKSFAQKGTHYKRIDLTDLNAGIYFLRLSTEQQVISSKIIKL